MSIPFGVHFGLHEDEYHADPALSQSGIKNLLVSPLTYWVNSNMNPNREMTESPALVIGTAIHKRIIEGIFAFHDEYAVAPSKEEYPDAINGADALRETCRTMGLKVSGTIAEMCERILNADPNAILWPEIMTRFKEDSDRKIILKPEDGKMINRMVFMVESHQEAKYAFRGGIPEVSIFWPCQTTGVRLKARIDYLKPLGGMDLKTFSNSKNLPVDRAVVAAVSTYGLHIQAVFYLRAIKTARDMIKRGMMFGAKPNMEGLLGAISDNPKTSFFFVFVETGDANNVIVREFPDSKSLLYATGKSVIDRSIAQYQSLSEQFGEAPWITQHETRVLDDAEFPAWVFKE